MGRVQWDPARCLLVGRAGEPAKHTETWRSCESGAKVGVRLGIFGENVGLTTIIYRHFYHEVIQHGQLNMPETRTVEQDNQP